MDMFPTGKLFYLNMKNKTHKARSDEHKIVKETPNDDWWRDIERYRLTFRQDQTLLDLNDNI